MKQISILIIFIALTLVLLLFSQQKSKKIDNKQIELNNTYTDNGKLIHNTHIIFDKIFFKTIGAYFLLDTLLDKNQEEFILVYHNSHWRDTVNNNFATKIVYDKIKKQWTYHRIDYIIYETPLKSPRFNKEFKQGKVAFNHTYYKDVTTGVLKNKILVYFLSDSLYKYRNRNICSTASGFSLLGHFKWINDTLKYREYDLRDNFDEESKRLQTILNLIKQQTSK